MEKTKLCTIKIHSFIDVITNSSTEIFCSVNGSTEEAIQDLLDTLMRQLECSCELSVDQRYKYDDETGDETIIEDEFDIFYETHQQPCKLILEKLKELLTVIE